MSIKQKITTATAAVTLLASVLLPGTAFAKTNIKIQRNGTGSVNKVRMVKRNMKFKHQSNKTVAITLVGSFSNTGGNSANGNTGGSVDTDTGDADTTVNVTVRGNSNTITPSECGCDDGNTNVTIKKNGRRSRNTVKMKKFNFSRTNQSNTTFVGTGVLTVSNTGGNTANWNTGSGVKTDTGNVDNSVTVTVGGSSNTN